MSGHPGAVETLVKLSVDGLTVNRLERDSVLLEDAAGDIEALGEMVINLAREIDRMRMVMNWGDE